MVIGTGLPRKCTFQFPLVGSDFKRVNITALSQLFYRLLTKPQSSRHYKVILQRCDSAIHLLALCKNAVGVAYSYAINIAFFLWRDWCFCGCAGFGGAADSPAASVLDVIPDIPDCRYDDDPTASAACTSTASVDRRAVGSQ